MPTRKTVIGEVIHIDPAAKRMDVKRDGTGLDLGRVRVYFSRDVTSRRTALQIALLFQNYEQPI